jgi:hypothetical protein
MYWQELNRSDPALASSAAAVWNRVASRLLSAAPAATHGTDTPALPVEPGAGASARGGRRVLAWAIVAAVAATVLVVLFNFNGRPGPGPWGWNRPGVLVRPESESVGAYFNRLADAAHEWFDERPATAPALDRRLRTFLADCSRLIAADQAHLPQDQRAWLVERCRAWAGRLDDAIHALEHGAPPDRVRADADAIINRLINALRDRARSVS